MGGGGLVFNPGNSLGQADLEAKLYQTLLDASYRSMESGMVIS